MSSISRFAAVVTVLLFAPSTAAAPAPPALFGKIQGRVLAATTGPGIPGVLVRAERDRDGARFLSDFTNPSGHYMLKVPLSAPAGDAFHIRTLAFGYTDAVGAGTASLGKPLSLDLKLTLRPTGIVSGTVTDAATGLPVANATVAVSCLPACNGIDHPPALTDANGRYLLRGVPFSPNFGVESGTPVAASMLACLPSGLYYPQIADRVAVDGPANTEDFILKAVQCGSPLPPPVVTTPPPPPSCVGVPIGTIDDHGRLVTSCLGPANETDVAVNPTNPLNIVSVAKDYSLGLDSGNTCAEPIHPINKFYVWTGVYTSFDGGISWANDLLPGFPGDNRPTNVPNERCMSDPVVAFAPNGELYLAALAWGAPSMNLKKSDLVLAKSVDGGQTWVYINSIYSGFTTGAWPDKPELAIDPNYATNDTVYVGWDLVTEPSETVDSKLTKVVNGAVASTEDVSGILSFPMPVVLRDGSLVVSGIGSQCDASSTGADGCVAVSRRSASSPPWSTALAGYFVEGALPTSDGYRADVIPTLAIDRTGGPNDGNVAVAWHSGSGTAPSTTGNFQLKVAYSPDVKNGGSTWNEVDPPPDSGRHQVLPRVGIDPLSEVVVLYYEDLLTGTTPLTARLIVAPEAGQPTVWGTPTILSVPFSPAFMFHQTGVHFIGDYVGLALERFGTLTDSSIALATWADGRNNRSDIYFKEAVVFLPPS